jgi:hypothetical protein
MPANEHTSRGNPDAAEAGFGQHHAVRAVLWDDVKQWFGPVENGSAPDVSWPTRR